MVFLFHKRPFVSCALLLLAAGCGLAQDLPARVESNPQLKAARQQLAQKHFAAAKAQFHSFLEAHPDSVEAQLGEGDAQLGLHEYEDAEVTYRAVVARQPQNWLAHKNLVVVEAALGRWEEFDRERAILADARRRNAPGISAHESDIIDSFTVAGQHWIVRAYDEPAGRSLTRYNFERFSAEGRVEAFLSLESASAAAAMLGNPTANPNAAPSTAPPGGTVRDYALDWYTGHAHGLVRVYMGSEPTYEQVRRDALRWIREQPAGTHADAQPQR